MQVAENYVREEAVAYKAQLVQSYLRWWGNLALHAYTNRKDTETCDLERKENLPEGYNGRLLLELTDEGCRYLPRQQNGDLTTT